ncbi:MAG: Ku protein [Deltaproteobacteria bacterium]|nr:Ku protein [Deltaproteobacteria bacterium]
MRAFWKGNISFGLVSIPVSLHPATKAEQQIAFHFLHEKDMGRIHNERICDKCGQAVAYQELARGYEYEKDEFVRLTKEDLEQAAIQAGKTIDIMDFVDEQEIDPMFFEKPYYLAPDPKGKKAYALLREVLKKTKKVGIAKVVFHTREHLAGVRAGREWLILEVMHFVSEFKSLDEIPLPKDDIDIDKRELKMAEQLVEQMTTPFEPEKYKNTYDENLHRMIQEKLEGKVIPIRERRAEATNVIDIMSKLKESLAKHQGNREKPRVSRKRAAG